MKEFSVAITTFSKRFDYASKLVDQVRSFVDYKLYLIVNGEKDGKFNENYRKRILSVCLKYDQIYPTVFTEIRGLAKLWNTAIINSHLENILVLNDDLCIQSNDIFDKVYLHINSPEYKGLTKINGSFSHFIVNKNLLRQIGFFDERLLGFGEEDGDITLRLLKRNIQVLNIFSKDVTNIVSEVRHEEVKPGIGKYSSFNRDFILNKKYQYNLNSQYKGMFDYAVDQILEDVNPYPLETFFEENKHKLF